MTLNENYDGFKVLLASDPLVRFLNRDEKQELYYSNEERRHSTMFKLQSFLKRKFAVASESSSSATINELNIETVENNQIDILRQASINSSQNQENNLHVFE